MLLCRDTRFFGGCISLLYVRNVTLVVVGQSEIQVVYDVRRGHTHYVWFVCSNCDGRVLCTREAKSVVYPCVCRIMHSGFCVRLPSRRMALRLSGSRLVADSASTLVVRKKLKLIHHQLGWLFGLKAAHRLLCKTVCRAKAKNESLYSCLSGCLRISVCRVGAARRMNLCRCIRTVPVSPFLQTLSNPSAQTPRTAVFAVAHTSCQPPISS